MGGMEGWRQWFVLLSLFVNLGDKDTGLYNICYRLFVCRNFRGVF